MTNFIFLTVLFFVGCSQHLVSAKVSKWTSIASDSTGNFLAGTSSKEGIYLSKDGGETWAVSAAPKLAWYGVASSSNGQHLAACALGNSIFLSNDYGVNWIRSQSQFGAWDYLAVMAYLDGQFVAVNSNGAILYSHDASKWARQDTGDSLEGIGYGNGILSVHGRSRPQQYWASCSVL